MDLGIDFFSLPFIYIFQFLFRLLFPFFYLDFFVPFLFGLLFPFFQSCFHFFFDSFFSNSFFHFFFQFFFNSIAVNHLGFLSKFFILFQKYLLSKFIKLPAKLSSNKLITKNKMCVNLTSFCILNSFSIALCGFLLPLTCPLHATLTFSGNFVCPP